MSLKKQINLKQDISTHPTIEKAVLSVDDIATEIELRTGIPTSRLMASDKAKLLALENDMHKQIVGQDLAIKEIANAIRRNSAGLSNPNKNMTYLERDYNSKYNPVDYSVWNDGILYLDKNSFDFGNSMIENEFRYYGFLSDELTNYLLFTYEPAEVSKDLGTAKTDVGLLSYAPVNDTFFALRYNGQGHDFDVYGTIAALEEYERQGKPVRIFGFPSFYHLQDKS